MKALTIPTIFTALDKFSGPVNKMANNSEKLQGKMERVGKVARTVAVTSFAVGAAIAAPLGMFAKAASDYETGLASLSAITGVQGKQFELFQKKVESVAEKTSRGPIEVAKAFELAGSAMPELLQNADALSKVSEASIVLSKASGDTLENSIRSLTGTMNQFSLGADNSERTINALAAGAKVGAASILQTSDAMVNFGSVAAGANLSIEQTVAAIQVMSKFGLFGAEAGTKLRGSLLRLQQTGLGYASGQFKINDALVDAKAKMDKLSTAKAKDAYLNKVFGAENISTGRILLSNIGLFGEYTKGITGTSEANIQAGIRMNTTAERAKAVRAQWELLSIKLGENVLPVINEIAAAVLPVIKSISAWVKENPALTKTLVKAAMAVAAFAFVISGIASVITAVTTIAGAFAAFPGIIAAVSLAFSNMVFGVQVLWALLVAVVEVIAGALSVSVGLVVGVFAFLVSLVLSVYRNWEMITSAFKNGGIVAGLKAIGATILDAILYPLQKVLEIVAKLPVVGKFAAQGALGIQGMREDMGIKTTEAVNPKAAEAEGMVNRTEQTNNAKVDVNINDPQKRSTVKASAGVNVTTSSTMNFGT